MKILVVSNFSGPSCGVAEYGRMCVEALRRAGHAVLEWDGHYPAIYEKSYLPLDADTYDWIHVNWHPVTLNHYAPQHFPPRSPVSLFLHDLPPWSTCPLWDRAQVRFAAEPYPGTVHLPYPAVQVVDLPPPPASPPVIVGWTGIRGDGLEDLQAVARRRGWTLNTPVGWLGTHAEIRRLRHSTLNVLWYHHTGRGQSLALMTAAAARRPLLISASEMFRTAWDYPREVYRAGYDPAPSLLEPAIDAVLDDVWKGQARIPDRLVEELSWARAVARMEVAWSQSRS
jgi:hypothetical protein